MPPRVVTLATDVGPVYSAQMKGALLRYLPPGHLVELTHDLPAHQIAESAFVLRQMTAAFPTPSVHVGVVDPGVGGVRAPLAIVCANGDVLVGPDNGLLIPTRDRCGGGAAIRLDPRRVVPGSTVSPTFEGRDLFAPAAGRIASGTRPVDLGDPWTPEELVLPVPKRSSTQLRGEVSHVDRFGNLITNLPTAWVESATRFGLRVGDVRRARVRQVRTYSDLRRSELGVLGSSFGTLELAVREGRASDRLGAAVGTRVLLAEERKGSARPQAPK